MAVWVDENLDLIGLKIATWRVWDWFCAQAQAKNPATADIPIIMFTAKVWEEDNKVYGLMLVLMIYYRL